MIELADLHTDDLLDELRRRAATEAVATHPENTASVNWAINELDRRLRKQRRPKVNLWRPRTPEQVIAEYVNRGAAPAAPVLWANEDGTFTDLTNEIRIRLGLNLTPTGGPL